MPHLTPDLPLGYRRRALTALDLLTSRAAIDLAQHRSALERLTLTGEPATGVCASLSFAQDRLALLRGRQRFLRAGEVR
jgi:hypothetical protein